MLKLMYLALKTGLLNQMCSSLPVSWRRRLVERVVLLVCRRLKRGERQGVEPERQQVVPGEYMNKSELQDKSTYHDAEDIFSFFTVLGIEDDHFHAFNTDHAAVKRLVGN
jgi:hypothetical protein